MFQISMLPTSKAISLLKQFRIIYYACPTAYVGKQSALQRRNGPDH
jgi:hypothetical protein